MLDLFKGKNVNARGERGGGGAGDGAIEEYVRRAPRRKRKKSKFRVKGSLRVGLGH